MDNPYLDECRKLPRDTVFTTPWETGEVFPMYDFAEHRENRRGMVNRYAWAIPSAEAIRLITSFSPLIEIGAGTGYWARCLAGVGADVVAFDRDPGGHAGTNDWHDNAPLWYAVYKGGAEVLPSYPDRTLFLCWPPYQGTLVTECLDAYRGDTLAYVGESGGCTGWDERLDEWDTVETLALPRWGGAHDRLMILKKKEKT